MFHRSLRLADHIRRYSIAAVTPAGWEVRCEEDQQVRRRDYYEDWHRVERAQASFEREVIDLTARGWLLL